MASALQLLKVCSDISSTVSRLEALLRTTVATVMPKLLEAGAAGAAGGGLDLIALRLAIFPDKVRAALRRLGTAPCLAPCCKGVGVG
jgi:Na+/serine symporter